MSLQDIIVNAPKCNGYHGVCIKDKFTKLDYEGPHSSSRDLGYCEISLNARGEIYYHPVCRSCYAHRNAYIGAAIMAESGSYIYHGTSYSRGSLHHRDHRVHSIDGHKTQLVGQAQNFRECDSAGNPVPVGDRTKSCGANQETLSALSVIEQHMSVVLDRYYTARLARDPNYIIDRELVLEMQKVVDAIRLSKNPYAT